MALHAQFQELDLNEITDSPQVYSALLSLFLEYAVELAAASEL